MKKLVLILAASFLLIGVSQAQIFNYGIKGGIGFSKVSIDDITGISSGSDVYDLVTGDGVTGYHLGVQTRIKILIAYIQPEIYWNAGGGTVEKVVDGGANEIMNIKFNRIDIPVLAGVKLGPFRINAGPVASLAVSEVNDFAAGLGTTDDYLMYSQTLNWGWQGGIGVNLGSISLDARYEGPLSDLQGAMDLVGVTNPIDIDPRPSQWTISLGYWFGK